jgi:UDP-2,3-diacylglucosamine pyrophosphatase LpxH
MEKLLFLSDIHLGGPRLVYADKLKNLLTSKPWDAIYIAGDLIDVWNADLGHILIECHEIISLLDVLSRKTRVIIIKGNHDPSAKILMDVFPSASIYVDYHLLYIGGDEAVIAHGHQVDPANWYLKSAYDFREWLERIFGESLINKIAAWIKQKFFKAAYTRPWNRVDAGAVKKWADQTRTIIIGHSHYAKILKTSGLTYINLGRMTVPNPTYAVYEDGKFKIKELV